MLLNIFVDIEKFSPFGVDENLLMYKSLETDIVPRVHDYIQDSGFEKELLVKKVIWNIEKNLCEIETKLVGSTKTIEEVKDLALSSGWKIFER